MITRTFHESQNKSIYLIKETGTSSMCGWPDSSAAEAPRVGADDTPPHPSRPRRRRILHDEKQGVHLATAASPSLTSRRPSTHGSTDGNLVLVFNGEIYNHSELRTALENAVVISPPTTPNRSPPPRNIANTARPSSINSTACGLRPLGRAEKTPLPQPRSLRQKAALIGFIAAAPSPSPPS